MDRQFKFILITINNYSHDIATAFLIVSGLLMFILYSARNTLINSESVSLFFRLFKYIKYTIEGSLVWIIIAGVPRTIFYNEYEWSDYAGDLQVMVIAVKHVVMFTLVGLLIFCWIRLSTVFKMTLKPSHSPGNNHPYH